MTKNDKSALIFFLTLFVGVPTTIGIISTAMTGHNQRAMLKMVMEHNANHPECPMTINFTHRK